MSRRKKFDGIEEIAQKYINQFPELSSDSLAEKIIQLEPSLPYSTSSLGRLIRGWINKNKVTKGSFQARVLLFDIETAPISAKVFNRWGVNIKEYQIKKDWYVICWSAKWLFEETMYGACVTPDEAIAGDDSRIMESLWRMLDEADVIIAHNLNKFDEKKSKARFIKHGFNPPSLYQKIDTLRVARSNFAITSNRLGFLAEYFGLPCGGKMDTEFKLWDDCDEGDKESLDYMQSYCDQDIYVLEGVYLKLRPWISNHPNIGLIIGNAISVCKNCGSDDLTMMGKPYRTIVNEYDTFRCGNCGAISKSRRASTPTHVKDSLLK